MYHTVKLGKPPVNDLSDSWEYSIIFRHPSHESALHYYNQYKVPHNYRLRLLDEDGDCLLFKYNKIK